VLDLQPLAGGLAWNTSQLYTSGVLSVGIAGDYNNNGSVDAADYILWRNNVQPLPNNEVVTIGTTEPGDYTEWRARFGNPGSGSGAGATDSASAAVPEPPSGVLAFLAVVGAFSAARRVGPSVGQRRPTANRPAFCRASR